MFRKWARIVRILCAVCIALKQYAMQAGFLESLCADVTTKLKMAGEEGEEELTFQVDEYKTHFEVTLG